MTTKPSQRPPGPQPGDAPGWRLAFAIWESLRTDGWTPILKLTVFIALILAALTVTAAVLGPWSLITALATVGGTASIRARYRRRDPTRRPQ